MVWYSLLKVRDMIIEKCGWNVIEEWKRKGYSVQQGYEALTGQHAIQP